MPTYHRRNPLAIAKLTIIDLYYAFYAKFLMRKQVLPSALTHILLVNPGHLGDVVISTAVLQEIKQHFPKCTVDIMVGDWAAPLVTGHPGINRAYYLNHWVADRSAASIHLKRKKYQEQLSQVIRELKANAYDAIFFLNSYTPSLISLFKEFTCPLVGFDTAGGGPLLTQARQNPNNLHEVQYQASLLMPWLGNIKSINKYHSWLKDSEQVNPLLPKRDTTQPYVLIHPGSGNPAKEWPLVHWQKVIEALGQYQINIVLTGQGEREASQADELMQLVPAARITNLVNQLTFDQFSHLVVKCEALFCVDSVAGHIGGAYNKPVVVVTNGLSLISRWHPLGKRVTLLENPVSCSPCHANPCKQRMCITDITPQALIQILPQLLPQRVVLQ